MVCQHALLFEWLEIVKAMGTFISHRMSSSEELCAKLERVESDLAVTQKVVVEGAEALKLVDGKKEMARAEANKLRDVTISQAKLREKSGSPSNQASDQPIPTIAVTAIN